MNDIDVMGKARERLLDAELATVLDVPLARFAETLPDRAQTLRRWAAAATILFGLCVALGVAWLRAHEHDEAQEPAYDPVFPWYEGEVPTSFPLDRFVQARDAGEVATAVQSPQAVVVLPHVERALVEAVTQRTDVRRLSITESSASRFTPELWQRLGGMPSLEMLIVGAEFQAVGGPPSVTAADLRELRRCLNLRSLTIRGSHEWVLDAAIGQALAEIPRLRCLTVSGKGMTSEGLAALAQLPLLRGLFLSSNDPLTSATGAAIAKLRHLDVLLVENRSRPDRRIGEELLSELRPMRSLRELALGGPMPRDALRTLPAQLQSLLAWESGFAPEDFARLLTAHPIRALAIFDDLTTWDEGPWNRARSQLEKVRILRPLSETQWQRLRSMPRLRALHVSLAHLSDVHDLAVLERLSLRAASLPADEDWRALLKLPRLRRIDLNCDPQERQASDFAARIAAIRRLLGDRIELVVY